ncbi:hypothetical protein MTYP_02836 [Methylophilaceae bacterium]|nr:hypothetical protein MTYP_02836 [Methylophilaceae bacterium]
MNYIDTAFKQLSFAWKLYNYALEGHINFDELDKPLTFKEDKSILVLPDKIFASPTELLVALENNLTIVFGAAAITLNRCREESGVSLANPIQTEIDHFTGVVYQIRNAFAHDIAEPRWNITNSRFARIYKFGDIKIDLSNVNQKTFKYSHIGGVEVFFRIKEYGDRNLWQG